MKIIKFLILLSIAIIICYGSLMLWLMLERITDLINVVIKLQLMEVI